MFVSYKCYILLELAFLMGLMFMKQLHQKSVIFVTISHRFHDLLTMSINLSKIAILNIKGSNYHGIISLINKNEAIKLLQNADLTEKSGIL